MAAEGDGSDSGLRPGDPRQVGPYRVVSRLGAGAMGQVYAAVSTDSVAAVDGGGVLFGVGGGQASTSQLTRIAVKVLHPHLASDPQFRRRFVRELAAMRRVEGPYTVAVIDGDPQASPPWIATELIDGPSLAVAVERDGTWPSARVRSLAWDIAHALLSIHAAGIVHRDLKPANILLPSGGPRVIDFGLAHAADLSQLTAPSHAPGTPSYMAPEQAEANEVTAAADVFALGAVLGYALIGRPVFGGGPPLAVLHRVVHNDPDLADAAADDPVLLDLIRACLSKRPQARPTPAEIVGRLAADRQGWVGRARIAAGRSVILEPAARTTHVAGVEAAASQSTFPLASTGAADRPSQPGRLRRGTWVGAAAAVTVVAVAVAALLASSHGSSLGSTAPPGSASEAGATGRGPLGAAVPGLDGSSGQSGAAGAVSTAGGSPAATPSGHASPGGTATRPAAATGSGSPVGAPSGASSSQVGPVPFSTAPAPSSSVGSPLPSTTPPATGATPVAYSELVGPGCGTMTRSGYWYALGASAAGGCGNGYWHNQAGDKSAVDWIFHPGHHTGCAFTLTIPNDVSITSTNALYQVYIDASNHAASNQLYGKAWNQAAVRGGTITIPVAPSTTGVYDLQVYDSASQGSGREYAGNALLTCQS